MTKKIPHFLWKISRRPINEASNLMAYFIIGGRGDQ
jgi:hypothetical protein